MPKPRANAALLSGMIEPDEDMSDVAGFLSSDSNQENRKKRSGAKGVAGSRTATAAAAAGRKKAKSVAKRLSPKMKTATAAAKRRGKKAPLKEQGAGNEPEPEPEHEPGRVGDTLQVVPEEEDNKNLEAGDIAIESNAPPTKEPPKRKGRPPKAKPQQANQSPEQAREKIVDNEFEYTPTTRRGAAATAAAQNRKQNAPASSAVGKTLPDTRMDLDDDGSEADIELPRSSYKYNAESRRNSRQNTHGVFEKRRRADSASDGEPALRRKLGDMTKKFENVELRYRNLHEIGVKEAEANFDKLKKHAEERNKVASELINSLRDELAASKVTTTQVQSLRSDITSAQSSLSTAEARVTQLTASLSEAQSEIKALQAKLAASRTANINSSGADATQGNTRTPRSAFKGAGGTGKTGNVSSIEAATAAQLKLDLYGDLTGLILRGVERGEDTDVFDCIQTGRNGTLHFKLAVPSDTSTSYEEAEVQYIPLFDAGRDRDLLELLPEYLQEEISFSNANAATFYSRVMDTLTKKHDGGR